MKDRSSLFRLIYILIYVLGITLLGSLFMMLFGVIIANIRGLDTSEVMTVLLKGEKNTNNAEIISCVNASKGFGNASLYLVVFICAIIFLKNDFVDDFSGLRSNKKFYIYYIIISSILFTGIAYGLSELFGLWTEDSENQKTVVSIMKSSAMIPMIISTVLFAPVVEELVYRKCIFYYSRGYKIYVRYIFSIVLFTLPHVITSIGKFSFGNYMLMIIPYFLDAFMLALIYHKGKYNIYTSICAHMLNNILAVILLFI